MNRIEAVHNLAKRKIQQLGLVPPVDVEKVIKSLNIEICEKANQLGIEAYSVLEDDLKIVINPEITYYRPRRNFTLAHELGHIFIPWHNGDLKCNVMDNYIKVDGKRLIDTQELEANIFASDFLMPQDWLSNIVEKNKHMSFDQLVELIAKEAKTSIMACFYALEQVLPSGYCYFVKHDGSEWWSFFASHNTYTINWFSYIEERMDFFDIITKSKEQYRIGPYEIVLYKMLSCPSKIELRKEMEKNGGNIEALINCISGGTPSRVLPFLDVLLNAIEDDRYIAFLFREDNLIWKYYSIDSPLRRFYGNMEYKEIRKILDAYGFEFQKADLEENMLLLFISEKKFEMPSYNYVDPNSLLKQICNENGYERKMLHSINGVMAAANSEYGKRYSDEELYNWCKYKFIIDTKYENFVSDERFDEYIVNKIVSMKKKRNI